MSDINKNILELKHVARIYNEGKNNSLEVLKDINLTVNEGEIIALVAPSGTGKSTLLHLAGLLEFPNKGSITLNGVDCSKLSDKKRSLIRQKDIGFVYQFHHLLPEFSALENVMMPLLISNKSSKESKIKALDLLDKVGLKERASHRPSKLSGGEQQRVAIARAIANQPALLLADEPTGNLDPATSEIVFNLLLSLVRDQGVSAVIATHNMDLARRMDRMLLLENGKLKPL